MKTVLFLIAASLVAFAYSEYAFPHRTGGMISATRSFSLNGRWYSVGNPSRSNTLIRDELAKWGFDVTRIPRETWDSNDLFLDLLSELPSKKNRSRHTSFPLPFRAKNELQMESDAGVVEITYGNVSLKGSRAAQELAANGWKIAETGKSTGPGFLATIRNGRETSIAFLEKDESGCLFIRQWEK